MANNLYFVFLLTLVSFSICENSGFNLIVNPENLKFLTTFDFNKFLNIKEIVIDKSFEGTFKYDYKLSLSNFTVKDIVPPVKVDTFYSKNEKRTDVLNVDIRGVKGYFMTNAELIYGPIHEKKQNLKFSIQIDSLRFALFFNEKNELNVSQLNTTVGDVIFDSQIERKEDIIELIKYLVNNGADFMFEMFKKDIQDYVREIVSHPIFTFINESINMTLMDQIKFERVRNQTKKKILNLFFGKVTDQRVLVSKFKGRFFMNSQVNDTYSFPSPVAMSAIKEKINNDFQFLISDYTVNTELYSLYKSRRLEFTLPLFPEMLPFESNVKGYSTIIPELASKYPNDNFIVFGLLNLNEDNQMPTVNTTENGMKINMNMNFVLLTESEPESVDLNLNMTTVITLKVNSTNGIIKAMVDSIEVKQIYVITDKINADLDNLKKVIPELLNKNVIAYGNKFIGEYDIAQLINQYLGNIKINLKNISIVTKNGYTGFTFDLNSYSP